MLSAVKPEDEVEQQQAPKTLSTLDLYKPLPSDDEEDDFEYKQDDVEGETGEETDFDAENGAEAGAEVEKDHSEEQEEVPEEEIQDIIRNQEQVYGTAVPPERRVFGNYRESSFVDAKLDSDEDEEYQDEEESEESEDDEDDEDQDDMMDEDDLVQEDEVKDNLVNFANSVGPNPAKELLLKSGKVLRNKKQVAPNSNPEPFEELLQARITSLLNPEA